MTAKQYLGQVSRLNKMIKNKITEIQQLDSVVNNITVLNENDRVQNNGSKDRLGDSVAKLVDLKNELSNLVDKYIQKRCEVIKSIEDIPETKYYEILFKRYVEEKKLEEICCEMDYSMQHIKRLHGEALEELRRMKGLS